MSIGAFLSSEEADFVRLDGCVDPIVLTPVELLEVSLSLGCQIDKTGECKPLP